MLKFFKKQRNVVKSYKDLFRTETGQLVLNDLMAVGGISRTSFDSDPLSMAYREGQRSIVLRIMKNVNITEKELNQWFEMQRKQLKELEEDHDE